MKITLVLATITVALLGSCTKQEQTADRDKIIAAIQQAEEAQEAALG